MKKIVSLLAVPALLLLAGVGCQGLYPSNPAKPIESTASPASPSAPAQVTGDEFNLAVAIIDSETVRMSWNAPLGMDAKTETFVLLHSAKPEPAYPDAFWYRRAGSDREAVWGNIPNGKRYFRVCEAQGEQCVKYSKVIEVQMP